MCSKALVLSDINKWFGAIHALRNINLSINEGEVIALLGDNGAGKSTLIKLIAGIESFDSGQISIQDKVINKQDYNVKTARKLGVETVYQSGSLGEQQSVWRNLFLGRHIRTRFGFIDQQQERQQAQDLLKKLDFRGVGANIDSYVSQLSGGERQGLAIGRAMLFNAKLVILDEPTTALSLGEVEKVLHFIETLKAQHRACLLITHNVNDAYRVADRFVVMDRGTIVAEYNKADMDQQSLQHALLSAVGRGAV